ncbi:3-phosphoglycerate kinase [Tanacetum coccineum]
MFIMGMAVIPLATKLIHEAVEFDTELFYDAHKVEAELNHVLSNYYGLWMSCGHVEKVYTSVLLSLIITQTQDLSVGSSLVEEDKLDLATTLLAKAKRVSLLLPIDMVIADKFAPDSNNRSGFKQLLWLVDECGHVEKVYTSALLSLIAQDLPVGSSLVEEDKLDLAYTLLAKAKGVSLLLPRYGHC